jgi:hypothetical protein
MLFFPKRYAAKLANMRSGERTDLEPSANLRQVSIDDAGCASEPIFRLSSSSSFDGLEFFPFDWRGNTPAKS